MSPAGDGPARPAQSGSRNLIARIAVALILIPLAIGAAWAGGWVWAALVVPVAVGLFVEWLSIVGARKPLVLAAGVVSLLGVAIYLGLGRIGATYIIFAVCVAIAALFVSHRRGWAALGGCYAVAALIGSLIVRRDAEYGFVALLLVFAVVWASDIGGYFAGKSIGGPKLAPRISPNKTWAGALGGFGLSLIVAVGFSTAGQGRLLPLLAVAAILSVVSQLGDLFESAIKRHFGVKDSSHIIPGHGGLLDRLDGFVAAIALAALVGFLRGGADGVGRGLMVW